MPNLYIATDWKELRFGTGKRVFAYKEPSYYCVENVSQELFDALVHSVSFEEYSNAITVVLFSVLKKKWISNN